MQQNNSSNNCDKLGSFGVIHGLNILVCEIPRSFERASLSNFRTQGSFIHINSGKVSNATFFRQTALQNLQRKNLGFSETDLLETFFEEK